MPWFGAGFLALLLVVTGASEVSSVSPPADVSVTCQNLRVMVSWECSRRQQPTTFEVMIKGALRHWKNETTECQYDLTSFLWRSETHYMDNYYVTVVAVEGGQRSKPMESRTFSFNRVKTVDDMCFLDFPPVNVIQKDSGVSASFANPFYFYPELRNSRKHNGAKFSFFVSSNSSHFLGSCLNSDETCKRDIHFAAGEEECVTLEGNLFDGLGVGQILFKKTKRICKSKELNVLMYVVPLAVAVPIIAVALVIYYKYKAWTMKPVPLPESLILNWRECQSYYHVSKTDSTMSRMTVQPSLSLKKEEEEQFQEPEPVCRSDGSSSSSISSGGQNKYIVRFRPGSDCLDSGSDQPDTRSTSVCSDSGEELAYDRPHMLVDLGDGEFVDGYRE